MRLWVTPCSLTSTALNRPCSSMPTGQLRDCAPWDQRSATQQALKAPAAAWRVYRTGASAHSQGGRGDSCRPGAEGGWGGHRLVLPPPLWLEALCRQGVLQGERTRCLWVRCLPAHVKLGDLWLETSNTDLSTTRSNWPNIWGRGARGDRRGWTRQLGRVSIAIEL